MKIGRRALYPAMAQVAALISPFIFLKLVVANYGVQVAVTTEVMLSLAGFCSIIVDWSSTTFLSRMQARLLSNGAYFSIIAAKLLGAGLLFGVIALALPFLPLSLDKDDLAIAMALLLTALAIDPSWIYVGRRQLWVPQGIAAGRFLSAILLTLVTHNAVLSLAASFLLTSIAGVALVSGSLNASPRVSFGLCRAILKRYKVPTVTEMLTAGFSRLDVTAAAFALPAHHALVYSVCRKLVVGLQSVAFASARLLYLERDPTQALKDKKEMAYFTAAVFVGGGVASYIAATRFFLLETDAVLIATLSVMLLLIPVGYVKNLIQFSYLYKNRMFAADFWLSALSAAWFFSVCACLYIFSAKMAVLFAVARLSADLVFVGAALAKAKHNALF